MALLDRSVKYRRYNPCAATHRANALKAAKFRAGSPLRPLTRNVPRIRAGRNAVIVFRDIVKRLLDVVGDTLATAAVADHRKKQNE